jgi:predicted RNase H-like HicB family nuclease
VDLFYTDDDGTYFVTTRDVEASSATQGQTVDDVEDLLTVCQTHTTTLFEERLDIPREPPHIAEHNWWNANVSGSTLFMPVADTGQQLLALLMLLGRNGIVLYDDRVDRFAGELDVYFESGLLDPERKYPLTEMEQTVLAMNAIELGIMGHNMVLSLQALGLGGWLFTGMNPLSIMGAFADEGVSGLGFRFQRDDDWTSPNPIGLDGHYESVCPPYHPDMHAATESMVEKKFGGGGAATTPRPPVPTPTTSRRQPSPIRRSSSKRWGRWRSTSTTRTGGFPPLSRRSS